MTEVGTWRLNDLDYFPCQCPNCRGNKPKEILAKTAKQRELFLAEHNLQVCKAELDRIKQAIRDGRLWEHVEMRAHAHPALLSAFKKLKAHEDFIEKHSPTVKRSGLFFFSSTDLSRPEVVHYRNRLRENYAPPKTARTLLLVPQTRSKPYHKAREYQNIRRFLQRLDPKLQRSVHVCFYDAPFGLVPIELDEVYPLSQHETVLPIEDETKQYVAEQVAEYVKRSAYAALILLHDPQNWNNTVKNAVRKACSANQLPFEHVNLNAKRQKAILTRLEIILKKNPSESS
jgi:7-cyano-7-deazaguanine tRNA-ribosyltransferase